MADSPRLRSSFLLPTILGLLSIGQAFSQNVVPVLDEPVQAGRVAPTIPGGRALLFPLTASDADGDRLTYTVKSSNPRILARVKTGNPFLKFTVNHAGGGPGDPAFSGDLVFMLLRDWTPITSGFIGGFAQSGYYDGTIFHRLTSLGGGATGFIFQGGDPLGTGLGGPGWKFDNELDPALIFVGRGQLAMANTGTNAQVFNGIAFGDFADSNGSQFFITDGQPRHLDFKHTIFAQLVRGWELMPLLRATQTTDSKPNLDVALTAASVVPTSGANNTDAVLVLSAIGAGTATITVTVDDRRGGKATKTFTVTAVKETVNAPPFIRKIPPLVTLKDTVVFFDIESTDLEHNYMDARHFVLQGFPSGGATSSGNRAGLRPAAGDDGLVSMGFDVAQYNVGTQAFAADRLATNAFIGVGDRIAVGERVTIEGEPGVAFTGVAGKIRDFDPAAVPGDFTATINWGDGTPLDPGTLGRDVASAGAGLLTVSGTHTYARAGVYPVVVNFSGNKGVVGVARGQAIIAATAIRAAGEALEITGATVKSRVVATFSDTASTSVPAVPGDYSALVDWGDGAVSDGIVARGAGGRFIVRGTHAYRDAERYAIQVRIHRKTDPPGVNDAWAWTSVALDFKATAHLPPFPKPNLLAYWNPALSRNTAGTSLGGSLGFINSGNRTLPLARLRYWLSADATLEKTGVARDTQLRVLIAGNTRYVSELSLAKFAAGRSINPVPLTIQLPAGDNGAGKYLLTELGYSDPLTDVEAIDKVIVTGPLAP